MSIIIVMLLGSFLFYMTAKVIDATNQDNKVHFMKGDQVVVLDAFYGQRTGTVGAKVGGQYMVHLDNGGTSYEYDWFHYSKLTKVGK